MNRVSKPRAHQTENQTPCLKTSPSVQLQPKVLSTDSDLDSSTHYWKNRPCPKWCNENHETDRTVSDVIHHSGYILNIILSTEDLIFDSESEYPRWIMGCLWQPHLDREPSLLLCVDTDEGGEDEFNLTAFEGLALTKSIKKLIRLAENDKNINKRQSELVTPGRLDRKRPYWQTTPCPEWCTRSHGRLNSIDEAVHASRQEAEFILSTQKSEIKKTGHLTTIPPIEISTSLRKNHFEAEPRIVMTISSDWKKVLERSLSIPEAKKLKKDLKKLTIMAASEIQKGQGARK
ncbi:hypothetical protein SUDANB121_01369 [Nocardiopsis dassonvillei]|uniref:hypothetical protein n=1 Tax=Nocardiopsis dassonvillei TaxID=2014 RepID=UPI003F570870